MVSLIRIIINSEEIKFVFREWDMEISKELQIDVNMTWFYMQDLHVKPSMTNALKLNINKFKQSQPAYSETHKYL